ncbi:DUF2127 domain-containing protein [Glaciimonas immobilis]|nr:DUF2127 domain-containing protein [Glaciimonas immobilis]
MLPTTQFDARTVSDSPKKLRTLRAIATFEGVKGIAAVAATLGLLSLLHHDIRHLALALMGHFGFDPVAHYPSIFLHYADVLSDQSRRNVALIGLAYVSLRFTESYGLWNNRSWATWLGAVSGAIYVPIEIRHLALHPSITNAAVLAGNIFVVAYLVLRIWRKRQAKRHIR